MPYGLNIRKDAELDFLSLGALIHRLDPGTIPFRKARRPILAAILNPTCSNWRRLLLYPERLERCGGHRDFELHSLL